jgi:hypothetical protein
MGLSPTFSTGMQDSPQVVPNRLLPDRAPPTAAVVGTTNDMSSEVVFAGPYRLTPIADTSDRFADFAPYVASVNNHGVVAFQAALRGGGSGVFSGTGGHISTLAHSASGSLSAVESHPDINDSGSVSFYASFETGRQGVVVARDAELRILAENAGPLGPTMDEDGTVAFRAGLESGDSGVFAGSGSRVTTIATTGSVLNGFHGLPVISRGGSVLFCADRAAGGRGIYLGDGESPTAIVETDEYFAKLGHFPTRNWSGTVAFVAALHGGESGVFTTTSRQITTVIDTSSAFESFRGVLLDKAGTVVFYATPRGGELGVFSGPDPKRDRILGVGASLYGSTVADFALNPVSINDLGQIAIRVKLANDLQLVLRADPIAPRHG